MRAIEKFCNRRPQVSKWGILILLTISLVCCVFLDGVEQPESINAGETFEATLRARVDAAQDRTNVRFIIGVLVPRSWQAGENTSISYTSNFGNGEFVRIPNSVRAANSGNNLNWPDALKNKFGIGPNLIDDMEWVVFWTREQYNIVNGDKPNIEAHISIRSGEQNMRFKFGYFIASSEDGLNDFLGGPGALYKTLFTDCFEVMEGEGEVQDFCNPPQTFVTPFRSTDNDILTLTYDRDILPGELGDEIYLCASAELSDGTVKEFCGREASHRLLPVEGARGRFEITFWPRQFFALETGESIVRLDYFFVNASGSVKVGYANDPEDPFTFTFRCD